MKNNRKLYIILHTKTVCLGLLYTIVFDNYKKKKTYDNFVNNSEIYSSWLKLYLRQQEDNLVPMGLL